MSDTRQLAARIVTEAGSPAIVVVLLPIAVAWHAAGHRVGATVLWGLVVAVFSSVLPMVFIVRGARQGCVNPPSTPAAGAAGNAWPCPNVGS